MATVMQPQWATTWTYLSVWRAIGTRDGGEGIEAEIDD